MVVSVVVVEKFRVCASAATGGVAVGGKRAAGYAEREIGAASGGAGPASMRGVEEQAAMEAGRDARQMELRVAFVSNVCRCAAKSSSMLFMIARAACECCRPGASSMRIRRPRMLND
ncbi:hypothetical protein DID96_10150 [Burkholderia sp. Bp8963]|uniref:hypothetical protein n=1 Tax=Burkholderia sp. Bp8963 TaxID=2184547 RepID=UPI000F5A36E7|nr:hypothetical protein [Burkholderia sp. Bp8963]RQS72580.1 hypothetical protein DID96_10150 [Burkholderia sp. Bp8963]